MSNQSQARPWGLAEVMMVMAVTGLWLWARTPRSCEGWRKLAVDVLALVAIAMVVVTLVLAASEKLTVIEPFDVPKSLEAEGYTGKIIAQQLMDRIADIKSTAKTRVDRVSIVHESPYASFANLQMPSSNLSAQTVISILRRLFRLQDDKIDGEIIVKQAATPSLPESYQLYLRFDISRHGPDRLARPTDSRHFVELKQAGNIDTLIDLAAQAIVEHTSPAIFASYLFSVRRWKDLDPLLDRLVVSSDNDTARRALTLRGMSLVERGRLDQALVFLRRAVDKDPGSMFARVKYGDGLIKAGKPDEAIKQFEKAREIKKGKLRALIAESWAMALQHKNEHEKAYLLLEEATKTNPLDSRIQRIWGDLLYDQRRIDEAVEKYRLAVSLDARSWKAYLNWGIALHSTGDLDGAIEKFDQASLADKRMPHPHCHAAAVRLDQNDVDGAFAAYQSALKLDPEFAQTSLCLEQGLARKSGLAKAPGNPGTIMQ
jgi:tetratricopeptide (TPR) repeat protein